MLEKFTAGLSRLCILMYHSISDTPHDPFSIHPQVFERQMAVLAASGKTVIGLDEALTCLYHQKSFQRTVVITFDDGYCDFLTTAVPVLKRFGFPATLFVPTGLVGGTARWHNYDKSKPLLNWDELEEAQRLGFTIASHTVSHPRLSQCSDTSLADELEMSLITLRQRLGNVLPILAYPFGDFGEREIKAARKAGYTGGVSTISRWGNYPWTNPFWLERVTPA